MRFTAYSLNIVMCVVKVHLTLTVYILTYEVNYLTVCWQTSGESLGSALLVAAARCSVCIAFVFPLCWPYSDRYFSVCRPTSTVTVMSFLCCCTLLSPTNKRKRRRRRWWYTTRVHTDTESRFVHRGRHAKFFGRAKAIRPTHSITLFSTQDNK